MYLHFTRRRGLGDLGPDPGGEANPPADCLSGAGPLLPGQAYCEGNDKTLALLKDFWNSTAPDPPTVPTNFKKYLVPVGVGVLALLLFSSARGR